MRRRSDTGAWDLVQRDNRGAVLEGEFLIGRVLIDPCLAGGVRRGAAVAVVLLGHIHPRHEEGPLVAGGHRRGVGKRNLDAHAARELCGAGVGADVETRPAARVGSGATRAREALAVLPLELLRRGGGNRNKDSTNASRPAE